MSGPTIQTAQHAADNLERALAVNQAAETARDKAQADLRSAHDDVERGRVSGDYQAFNRALAALPLAKQALERAVGTVQATAAGLSSAANANGHALHLARQSAK